MGSLKAEIGFATKPTVHSRTVDTFIIRALLLLCFLYTLSLLSLTKAFHSDPPRIFPILLSASKLHHI